MDTAAKIHGDRGTTAESVAAEARDALLGLQADDGHWLFELEADATIPAEYILLNHYLGEIDDPIEAKIAVYLRRIQEDHGGWPLFHGGDFNLSTSVKAYFALKAVGDDPEADHMRRAREAILAHGGAARVNVFTRFALALFGELPWKAMPMMRVELVLAPRWFPFNIYKMSYWSRTVMVPLLVLAALKPRARNPRGIHIAELFASEKERSHGVPLTNPTGHWLGAVLIGLDRLARVLQPLFPGFLQRRAIDRAMDFISERLNGKDGLGAIFPAIVNSVMAFDALGYPRDHHDYETARDAVDKLLAIKDDWAYCQPCLSPVWDTGLALHALMDAGGEGSGQAIASAADWLAERQITDVAGDWAETRPDTPPGGWAFQYWNDHYPDVDDTAVVAMALHRADPEKYQRTIARARDWIIGMQSRNGGWGSFDADNDYLLTAQIPFADHGAMLDPPTADVTARCVSFLAQIGAEEEESAEALRRGLDYLRREQEEDGSWFGRWGTNYVYGTWSVLCALRVVGQDMSAPWVRKSVAWLESFQQDDGGWGEDCATYWRERRGEVKASTPSQTAWALLGLMAAGEERGEAVARGVDYLLEAPREGASWDEAYYNAVGFPRIFYLRYHGYCAYFPMWALARYSNLTARNERPVDYGM